MLLLFVISLFIFVFLLCCFVLKPKKQKRIIITVYHEDSSYEKAIDIKQTDPSKKYKITPESDGFLQIKNKKIFICSPYPELLIPLKKYPIGNGISISMKKQPLCFLILFSIIISFMIIPIFTFNCFAKSMIPSFINASNQVVLTHDFAEKIDLSKWNGIKNYLIVGSDAREGLKTSRTDVMVIFSFNENTKKVKICSLLRDLRVAINDKTIVTVSDLDSSLPNYEILKNSMPSSQFFQAKLNYAVNIPYLFDNNQVEDKYACGLNTLVNTIEYNFEIPIEGIVSVTWEDFITIIDTLGGIDLEITEQMLVTYYDEEHAYGIMPVLLYQNALYNKTDSISEAGIQHLNGNQALAFVRLRYIKDSVNSDIARTERIRYFLVELLKQKKWKLFTFLDSETISSVSENIYSSLSQDDLSSLVDIICSIPTPENCGTLPVQCAFNEQVIINGANYITVDGIHQDKLSKQAEQVLCN